jgi:hypothetical protein
MRWPRCGLWSCAWPCPVPTVPSTRLDWHRHRHWHRQWHCHLYYQRRHSRRNPLCCCYYCRCSHFAYRPRPRCRPRCRPRNREQQQQQQLHGQDWRRQAAVDWMRLRQMVVLPPILLALLALLTAQQWQRHCQSDPSSQPTAGLAKPCQPNRHLRPYHRQPPFQLLARTPPGCVWPLTPQLTRPWSRSQRRPWRPTRHSPPHSPWSCHQQWQRHQRR